MVLFILLWGDAKGWVTCKSQGLLEHTGLQETSIADLPSASLYSEKIYAQFSAAALFLKAACGSPDGGDLRLPQLSARWFPAQSPVTVIP